MDGLAYSVNVSLTKPSNRQASAGVITVSFCVRRLSIRSSPETIRALGVSFLGDIKSS